MKKLKPFEVYSMKDSVRHIFRIATQFKSDVDEIKLTNFKDIYKYAQQKYKKEVGEIFRRPKLFIQFGGDCDCQSIFLIAMMLKFGISPQNINLLVCGSKGYTHIFPIINVCGEQIYFDMLPKRKYGEQFKYKFHELFNYYC